MQGNLLGMVVTVLSTLIGLHRQPLTSRESRREVHTFSITCTKKFQASVCAVVLMSDVHCIGGKLHFDIDRCHCALLTSHAMCGLQGHC